MRAAVFGPEVWRSVAGGEWSFWDLWFCVVCVLDHDEGWAGLDAAIARDRGSDAEAKWSHLLDLTARLDRVGLTAADLAGAAVRDPKVRAKARTKVLRSALYERDLTGPMRRPLSARLTAERLFGSWPRFAVSPQPFYDQLQARHDLEGGRHDSGWATSRLAARIHTTHRKLVDRAGDDVARQLAVRRATLSLLYQAAEIGDDSSGELSATTREVVEEYARTDWRATAVAAEVYWRDLLGWCALAGNHGVLYRIDGGVFRWAKVGHDLDLIDAMLVDLAEDFGAARMRWCAEDAQAMRASAVAASGRVTRFATTAEAIGAARWTAVAHLVDAAVRRRRVDVAGQVLDAAEAAGIRPEWVRQRRAEIGAGTQ